MTTTTVMIFYFFVALIPQLTFSQEIRTYGGNGGGRNCEFPFIYDDQRYYACTDANHDRPWCSMTFNYDVTKTWGNCVIPAIETTGGSGRGANCSFPFRFLGHDRFECITDYHNQPWCGTTRNYDATKQWGNCVPGALTTVEGNAYGAPCCFPFRYKGETFDACTPFDTRYLRPWCSTTPDYDINGQWGYCQIRTRGGNSNGALCKFPFYWNGKEYGRCVVNPEMDRFEPWCATTYYYNDDVRWGYCINENTHTCQAQGPSPTEFPGLSTTLPSNRTTIAPGQQVECVYAARLEDTNALGGIPVPEATTIQECSNTCDGVEECRAFDWDTNNDVNLTSRCWWHRPPVTVRDGQAPGVFHYRKLQCSQGAGPPARCNYDRRDRTNAYGAQGIPGVSARPRCEELCTDTADCVAYEWESRPNPRNNIQCFIHTNRQRVEDLSFESADSTITQFRKLC